MAMVAAHPRASPGLFRMQSKKIKRPIIIRRDAFESVFSIWNLAITHASDMVCLLDRLVANLQGE
jgi:hypothetical protein